MQLFQLLHYLEESDQRIGIYADPHFFTKLKLFRGLRCYNKKIFLS